MVNSIYMVHLRRRWFALLAWAFISTSAVAAFSQEKPYYSNAYRIYSNPPAARVARAPVPRQPLQPFRVDLVDDSQESAQPTASVATNENGRYAALNRAFGGGKKAAVPSGRVQDIFGENPTEDVFGEKPDAANPEASPNPFQKVDPSAPGNVPQNPFGEMAPREDTQQPNNPSRNPFNELSQDPTPITPPMDTDPKLPPGSEFTPTPGLIDPNPPVPGEETRPRPGDDNNPRMGEEVPDLAQDSDPGNLENDSAPSIFDTRDTDDRTEQVAEDTPVPTPASSRVYLPARDPTDYVKPSRQPMMIPPGYDPALAMSNPYAGLPGPYGYATPPLPAPPLPNPYPGYPPPHPWAAGGYGQCGPGCTPTSLCSSCRACGSCSAAMASAEARCDSCPGASQPTLAETEIGERIVETAEVAACDPDAYTEVVPHCDSVCSNFASCYVGVFGGLTDLNDFAVQSDQGRGIWFEDSGYLFGFTVGQIQGRNLRTELELSYRNISVNGLRLEGSAESQFVGVHGDFGTLAGMFNGYWEFVDFGAEKIKPYLGGGVGFALARPNLLQNNGLEAVTSDEESSFAWQWMAGLNYKASPTLDAFVEYRYFAADSFRLDTEIPAIAGLGNGSGPFDYRSGAVLFGMRARF